MWFTKSNLTGRRRGVRNAKEPADPIAAKALDPAGVCLAKVIVPSVEIRVGAHARLVAIKRALLSHPTMPSGSNALPQTLVRAALRYFTKQLEDMVPRGGIEPPTP